jgi:hypothetical protein
MSKGRLFVVLLAPFFCLVLENPIWAQAKEYTLLGAFFEVVNKQMSTRSIEISFGKNFPEDSLLTHDTDWLVQKIKRDGSGPAANVPIQSVDVDRAVQVVTITLKEDVVSSDYQVTILFRHGDLPSVVVEQPKKQGVSANFKPARGKADADIYFNGSAAGARGSKPLYSFESKLGYLWRFKPASFGFRATANAAEKSNIDPDSITGAVALEKIIVLSPLTGIILEGDVLGTEFDTKNRTRNLTSGLDSRLILPPKLLGEKSFAAIDFLVGFEGGHNYRHKLNPDGLGNFWRWKLGSTVYFVVRDIAKLNRISFTTEYKVRLLNSFEPFTESINGTDVVSLRKKPRHYVASDLDLMFSDAFGITIKYRYGSLPPAFKFVNNSVSIGLTFKLKQANK